MKKYAIITIDMLNDTFRKRESGLAVEGYAVLPALNRLLKKGREAGMPIIFAMDSFFPQDYFFAGKKKAFSLRGTDGAKVIPEIEQLPTDMYLPKRRWSAFYKTDLDQILRVLKIDAVVLSGITTGICVLATALDALSHDFEVIIAEDCCAAATKQEHQAVVDIYRKSGLFPFLRVMPSDEFWKETAASL
ncbi:MAG: cysteine hydrolase family protein [Syntrophobacteraceae bacterium]